VVDDDGSMTVATTLHDTAAELARRRFSISAQGFDRDEVLDFLADQAVELERCAERLRAVDAGHATTT
jgi:hypothetical protein